MKKLIKTEILLASILFIASPTYATTLIHQSFQDIATNAANIFEGTVVSQNSHWSDDKATIYTDVTFGDIDILKAQPESTTSVSQVSDNKEKQSVTKTLRFLGGEVEGNKVIISGMPIFENGDRVILFVRDNGIPTMCPVVGWLQGIFHVETNPETGDRSIRDGFNRKVLEVDHASGELITAEERKESKPKPVPVMGSPDKLVTEESLDANLNKIQQIPIAADIFKEEIVQFSLKQVSQKANDSIAKPSLILNSLEQDSSEGQAVLPAEVNP